MSEIARRSLQRHFVEALGEHRVSIDEPLGELTTYRVGGRAAVLVVPRDAEELKQVVQAASSFTSTGSALPVLVVGRGSNMLVSDHGFAGLVILLGDAFDAITIDGTVVTAGGATKLPILARRSASEGLTGFEWAVGVPGSVGGAIRMNAGGHGAEISDSLVVVEIIDITTGMSRSATVGELDLSYRQSNIVASEVVVAATFQLAMGDREASQDRLAEIVRWRLEHQPGGQNAGSVFTNPVGESAGRLIDAAGLKGHRIGSAEVSTKHANFIQVDPDGSAEDVARLMAEIIGCVQDFAGVELHPETRLVGFEGQE